MNEGSPARQVAEILIRGLNAGKIVEIEELGVFYPDAAHGFRFEPRQAPQVFIAHVQEDAAAAERLSAALEKAGFRPWTDARKLLAGQNWPRAIEHAIESSDFFLACFSRRAVTKRGGFQAEIRYALDCARRLPLEEVFLVPVRLDECAVPRSIQRELQYVDLFPSWEHGVARLVTTMRRECLCRWSRGLPALETPGDSTGIALVE
jgi:hypothetical protein